MRLPGPKYILAKNSWKIVKAWREFRLKVERILIARLYLSLD